MTLIALTCPGRYTQCDLAGGTAGTALNAVGVYYLVVQIVATWRIRLNRLCAAAVMPFWQMTLTTLAIIRPHRPYYVRTGWPKKFGTIILYTLTLPNITDFQNYFSTKIRRKFELTISLKIPSHLKCVATLPCEMSSVLKATVGCIVWNAYNIVFGSKRLAVCATV